MARTPFPRVSIAALALFAVATSFAPAAANGIPSGDHARFVVIGNCPGPQPVSFRRLGTALLDAAPPAFSGDLRLRAIGWRRDALAPLWRIADDTPLPMTLLSVTTETRITD